MAGTLYTCYDDAIAALEAEVAASGAGDQER